MQTTWLANFFNKQREIIEAAETPFAKLAIFILPILAPSVPAFMTGLHVYKLLLTLFTYQNADTVSFTLSTIVSIVLEMLGYVGAISFIQSLFRWVRTREDIYILPFALNGFAYLFYLVAMYLINVELGKYFGTPEIVNNIVGLLSFITVPTSLLAANHLSQKEEREESFQIRQESRQDRLERYKIKHGNLQTYQQVTGNLPEPQESYQKVSTDWRKVSSQLSNEQVSFIANSEPKDIVSKFAESKFYISPRTASNWRMYARKQLGLGE